ncbi:MAG: hypothetical protein ACJAV6_000191 [Candidatus Paceibacteria bacterium]|jgi:hypothetical protein
MKTLARQLNKDQGRKKIFTTFLLGIVVSFLLYGFGITSTTLSVADAETHNHEINELQTEIAELEISYFEIINTLSEDEALLYGFNQVENVKYAHIDQTKSVAYNR